MKSGKSFDLMNLDYRGKDKELAQISNFMRAIKKKREREYQIVRVTAGRGQRGRCCGVRLGGNTEHGRSGEG